MSAQLFIALIKKTYGFNSIYCDDDDVLEIYSPEQCNIPLGTGIMVMEWGCIKNIIDTHLKNDDEECGICYEPLGDQTTLCGRCYKKSCVSCIMKTFKLNGTKCPYCRYAV